MIFAIRRPSQFKGVYTTPDTIKKIKESIKGVKGISSREFKDDELEQATAWADVKGSADVKQVAVNKIHSTLTETEVFLDMLNKYKKLGYSYAEIYFKDRDPLGVLLKGAALGELRSRYSYNEPNLEENIEYSLNNNYIKTIYYPTNLAYNHPVLFIENAYTLTSQPENSNLNNLCLNSVTHLCINMDLKPIVEIKAFKTYCWKEDKYSSTTYKFTASNFELYDTIKNFI